MKFNSNHFKDNGISIKLKSDPPQHLEHIVKKGKCMTMSVVKNIIFKLPSFPTFGTHCPRK